MRHTIVDCVDIVSFIHFLTRLELSAGSRGSTGGGLILFVIKKSFFIAIYLGMDLKKNNRMSLNNVLGQETFSSLLL